MLRTPHIREKLRAALLKSGVTGEIGAHGAQTNLEALKRLMKRDPYVTFGIRAVSEGVEKKEFTYTKVVEVMATALGTTVERFHQPGPGYIDPQLTAHRLGEMLDLIDEVGASGGQVLLATAHPGSLFSYYTRLTTYITEHGGHVLVTPKPFKVGDYRWIDQVSGVHVLTDEGNLLHTHDAGGFTKFLEHLPSLPDLVLTDHGYAGAAINLGVKTVSIHDVDDPGIAIAAHLGLDVLAIPMNDNQLNQPTVGALDAILQARATS